MKKPLSSMPAKSQDKAPEIFQQAIREHFLALYRVWGPQHWWPGRTRFEVIVGAYLTQNTSWKNVEAALKRLRAARRLTLSGIRDLEVGNLESLIQPAGYFRQKARSLKNFVGFVDQYYAGSLQRMFAQPTIRLREQLLSLKGVGPETADSILLYAGQHPVFVVDAYTRRIFTRHGLIAENTPYEEIRAQMEAALSPLAEKYPATSSGSELVASGGHRPTPMSGAKRSAQVQVYNEMHGLLVAVGKKFCLKAAAKCEQCPLRQFLPPAAANLTNPSILP